MDPIRFLEGLRFIAELVSELDEKDPKKDLANETLKHAEALNIRSVLGDD